MKEKRQAEWARYQKLTESQRAAVLTRVMGYLEACEEDAMSFEARTVLDMIFRRVEEVGR